MRFKCANLISIFLRSCRDRSKLSVPANDRATSRACSWISRGILDQAGINGKTFTPNQTGREACFDDTLESDMLVVPDPTTAFLDPFAPATTLIGIGQPAQLIIRTAVTPLVIGSARVTLRRRGHRNRRYANQRRAENSDNCLSHLNLHWLNAMSR